MAQPAVVLRHQIVGRPPSSRNGCGWSCDHFDSPSAASDADALDVRLPLARFQSLCARAQARRSLTFTADDLSLCLGANDPDASRFARAFVVSAVCGFFRNYGHHRWRLVGRKRLRRSPLDWCGLHGLSSLRFLRSAPLSAFPHPTPLSAFPPRVPAPLRVSRSPFLIVTTRPPYPSTMAGNGGKRAQTATKTVSPAKMARLAVLQAPTRADRDVKDWMRTSSGPNVAVAQPPLRLLPSSATRPTLTPTSRFGVPSAFPSPASYFEEFRGVRPDVGALPGTVHLPESGATECPQTEAPVGSIAALPTALPVGSLLSCYGEVPENNESPMVDASGMVNAPTVPGAQQAAHGVLAVAPSVPFSAPTLPETAPMTEPLLDTDPETEMRNALFGPRASGPASPRRATISGLPSLSSYGKQAAQGTPPRVEGSAGQVDGPVVPPVIPARPGRRGGARRATIGAPPASMPLSVAAPPVSKAPRQIVSSEGIRRAVSAQPAPLASVSAGTHLFLPPLAPLVPGVSSGASVPSAAVSPVARSAASPTPREGANSSGAGRSPPVPAPATSSGGRPPRHVAGAARATPCSSPPPRGASSGRVGQRSPTAASTPTTSALESRVISLESFVKQSVDKLQQGMETHGASLEKMAQAVGVLQATACKAEANTSHEKDDTDKDDDGSSTGELAVMAPDGDLSDEVGITGAPRTTGNAGKNRAAVRTARVVKTGFAKVQAAVRARADTNLEGLRSMLSIRPLLQTAVNRRIAFAVAAQHAFPPPEMMMDMTLVTVQAKRGGTIEEAEEFLLSDICKPTKVKGYNSSNKPMPTIKASVPLSQVLPHTIENLKKRMVPAWFARNGCDMLKMSDVDAIKWLYDDKYSSSINGATGIRDAVKDGLLFLGADNRVKDGGVGVGQLVECTTGHFNMASCFVRAYLELIVAGDRGRRRTGKDHGWYVRYRAEGMRTARFLPTDEKAHYGMVFIDAADDNKMNFDDDEGEAAKALYMQQEKFKAGLDELLASRVPSPDDK